MSLKSADELGRFKFGSTVILLFNESLDLDKKLTRDDKVLMGEGLSLTPS